MHARLAPIYFKSYHFLFYFINNWYIAFSLLLWLQFYFGLFLRTFFVSLWYETLCISQSYVSTKNTKIGSVVYREVSQIELNNNKKKTSTTPQSLFINLTRYFCVVTNLFVYILLINVVSKTARRLSPNTHN